jgi:hypothetical protein
MDISSIDFTSLSEASEICIGIFVDVDTYVVLIPVRGTASSGIMASFTFFSFYFISLSISASISLICAFFSMINFSISSFWIYVSATYLVCESYVVGSFSCFLSDAISEFFFFINSSAALTLVGSYPILRTNSSNDFILLYLAKEEIFSSFNWDWILFKDTCNLEAVIELFVRVEKIIFHVCMCMSIWSTR